jgi:hypothetical protein
MQHVDAGGRAGRKITEWKGVPPSAMLLDLQAHSCEPTLRNRGAAKHPESWSTEGALFTASQFTPPW